MARKSGEKPSWMAPERPFELPGLTAFGDDPLEARRDYEAIDFVDRDFTGQGASDARFLACRMLRCRLDGLSLRRARIIESMLADVHGATVEMTDSTWRDSRLSGGRLGAAALTGATWTGIRVRGSKLGFLDLAGKAVGERQVEVGRVVAGIRLHGLGKVLRGEDIVPGFERLEAFRAEIDVLEQQERGYGTHHAPILARIPAAHDMPMSTSLRLAGSLDVPLRYASVRRPARASYPRASPAPDDDWV